MSIQLNAQASAALAEIIRKNDGQLPAAVEQKLQGLDVKKTGQVDIVVSLTLADIQKLLLDAMPDAKQMVQDACSVGSGYHADGKNAQFLTQILSTKVLKEVEVQAGRNDPVRRYDPLFAEFTMDPAAKNMLLFNARNVDRTGNPLLMKIVMRMTPKVEAVVTSGEREIQGLLDKTQAQIKAKGWNFTEQELRAAWGLQSDGADHNNVSWIKQNLASNLPESVATKARLDELTKEVDAAKQRYIDENLPQLDLTRYRQATPETKPDVALVGAKATFVKSVDLNENEFTFGDPLKQVSLSAGNKEISTSVFVRPENEQFNRAWNDPANQAGRNAAYDSRTTGDNLDRQPVATFDDRVRLSVTTKEGKTPTPGQWLDDQNAIGQFDVKLHIDRGLIFEPGAHATVAMLGTNVATNIPVDDANLKGNEPSVTKVDTERYASYSLRQLLNTQVTRSSWAQENQSDLQNQPFTVASLVYANSAHVHVGANALAPLGDAILGQADLAANKMGLDATPIEDKDKDGVRVRLQLGDGFLGADASAASVKGWTIQVGYFDANNKWVEEKTRTVTSDAKSKAEQFTFDIDDFQALQRPKDAAGAGTKHLEVRVYNADGVPAQRVRIPFREAVWTD